MDTFQGPIKGLRLVLSQELINELANFIPKERINDYVYTVESVDEDDIATLSWQTDDGKHSITYTKQEVIEFINNNKWIIV